MLNPDDTESTDAATSDVAGDDEFTLGGGDGATASNDDETTIAAAERDEIKQPLIKLRPGETEEAVLQRYVVFVMLFNCDDACHVVLIVNIIVFNYDCVVVVVVRAKYLLKS